MINRGQSSQYVQNDMFIRETVANNQSPLAGSRPILYIHGLGESGLCFEHLLTHPGLDGFNHLIPDLPGYGRSTWIDGDPLTLTGQADHLAGWLENINSGPVSVVAHSMGGIVGLLLAERHPELVGFLIDVDGNKSIEDCVFSSRAVANGPDEFLLNGFDVLRETVFRRGREDPAQRGYYASMRLADPRAYFQNSAELVEMSRSETLANRLAMLPMPTHYIAGVPNGASAQSRTLLTAAQVAWTAIEPSGHWPFIDQTDQFVEVLVDLLITQAA